MLINRHLYANDIHINHGDNRLGVSRHLYLYSICPGEISHTMNGDFPLLISFDVVFLEGILEHLDCRLSICDREDGNLAERINPGPKRLFAQPPCPLYSILPKRETEPRQMIGERISDDLNRVSRRLLLKDLLPFLFCWLVTGWVAMR